MYFLCRERVVFLIPSRIFCSFGNVQVVRAQLLYTTYTQSHVSPTTATSGRGRVAAAVFCLLSLCRRSRRFLHSPLFLFQLFLVLSSTIHNPHTGRRSGPYSYNVLVHMQNRIQRSRIQNIKQRHQPTADSRQPNSRPARRTYIRTATI